MNEDRPKGASAVSTTTPDELRVAIEGLYRTFSRYNLTPHVPGCDHCTSDADHAAIHSAPLRQLTADNLSRYAFKATTTWGSPDDFRHFLPRIFELLAAGNLARLLDPEVAFGKLAYGNWRGWPSEEQAAVERFLGAFWQAMLTRYPNAFPVDEVLCCVGQAEDDLTPYLDYWNITGARQAACHFAAFVESNVATGSHRRKPWSLRNPFWSGRATPASQVVAWLLDANRVNELERAFFTFGDEPDTAGLLSAAFNDLSLIRMAAGVA